MTTIGLWPTTPENSATEQQAIQTWGGTLRMILLRLGYALAIVVAAAGLGVVAALTGHLVLIGDGLQALPPSPSSTLAGAALSMPKPRPCGLPLAWLPGTVPGPSSLSVSAAPDDV